MLPAGPPCGGAPRSIREPPRGVYTTAIGMERLTLLARYWWAIAPHREPTRAARRRRERRGGGGDARHCSRRPLLFSHVNAIGSQCRRALRRPQARLLSRVSEILEEGTIASPCTSSPSICEQAPSADEVTVRSPAVALYGIDGLLTLVQC